MKFSDGPWWVVGRVLYVDHRGHGHEDSLLSAIRKGIDPAERIRAPFKKSIHAARTAKITKQQGGDALQFIFRM